MPANGSTTEASEEEDEQLASWLFVIFEWPFILNMFLSAWAIGHRLKGRSSAPLVYDVFDSVYFLRGMDH